MIEVSRNNETEQIRGGTYPAAYITSLRVQYGSAAFGAMYLYGLQQRPDFLSKTREFDMRRKASK